eukprot:5639750-Pleurochrysis_carterae.AAC.2
MQMRGTDRGTFEKVGQELRRRTAREDQIKADGWRAGDSSHGLTTTNAGERIAIASLRADQEADCEREGEGTREQRRTEPARRETEGARQTSATLRSASAGSESSSAAPRRSKLSRTVTLTSNSLGSPAHRAPARFKAPSLMGGGWKGERKRGRQGL